MAKDELVSRIAGYRSRDRDEVLFLDEAEAAVLPGSGLVKVIEPGQIVLAGEADPRSRPEARRHSGSWGRTGPAPPDPRVADLDEPG